MENFGIVITTELHKERMNGGIARGLLTMDGGTSNVLLEWAAFNEKDTSITEISIGLFKDRIVAIGELDGRYVRASQAKQLRNTLQGSMDDSSIIFTRTCHWIDKTYARPLRADLKNEAGQHYFNKSRTNYADCGDMMNAVKNFMTDERNTAMEGAGMPTTFRALALETKDTLKTNGDAYTAMLQHNHDVGNDRIDLVNVLYDDYIITYSDLAKDVYRDDKAKRDGVVYSPLLATIREPHQVLQIVGIELEGANEIANAVKYAEITNVGVDPVDVYDKLKPIIPANKHTLLHGEHIQNTFGSGLVFQSQSTHNIGKIETVRVVYQKN